MVNPKSILRLHADRMNQLITTHKIEKNYLVKNQTYYRLISTRSWHPSRDRPNEQHDDADYS